MRINKLMENARRIRKEQDRKMEPLRQKLREPILVIILKRKTQSEQLRRKREHGFLALGRQLKHGIGNQYGQPTINVI